MKFYAILSITGALLVAATNALPTRIAERQPTRQFGGSRPPPNSPHLAHYNGTDNAGDNGDHPENDTASYIFTFSSTSTSSTTMSTSTAMESSSGLPLPVEETQSVVVPIPTGSSGSSSLA
ncbi:MAG: hypothetical protein NXY57DRAFT_587155 [Lentinula lateritia]|nr:MAG: hypothetical protein NXY57DRAFT_587155 [Lentinula lateritia]